ncbi:UDP-glucose 4-epimerase GalE [Candidatus Uabimicrobium amorphum]|uniref:UDP-glucose 4-epimerase n=2 Tax=Uabimicrobium amorphum TaxID=2596890 RepID=A0A5S9INP6_UABAM|nr:UDP-glucose 4-epimerase GalE [Candidatus Uabimicrobium amorphum]
MATLVTGGAGYIGSVIVELLNRQKQDFVVLDNLSRGNEGAVPKGCAFYRGDIKNHELVKKIIDEHNITQCIHLAAYAYVGESVVSPHIYFENNISSSLQFIDTLRSKKIDKIVFSSSCAVYGIPSQLPIVENEALAPINPYGWSKLTIEKVLESYAYAYDLNYVALRYFNACGATEQHGEFHQPETHIIPNILAVAKGEKDVLCINGSDYPTSDGTAVRDYIHVYDLACAHIAALEYLQQQGTSQALNLGNGQGYSIMDLVNAAKKVTQKHIAVEFVERRVGDPPLLVADAAKAKKVLGWEPKFSCIEKIMESAWLWKIQNPNGYTC